MTEWIERLPCVLREHGVELAALGAAFAGFFTAWANHLLGVYTEATSEQYGRRLVPIRRGHYRCWLLACSANFAVLELTILLLLIAAITFDVVILVLLALIVCFWVGSIYPWLFVAPLRFQERHYEHCRRASALPARRCGGIPCALEEASPVARTLPQGHQTKGVRQPAPATRRAEGTHHAGTTLIVLQDPVRSAAGNQDAVSGPANRGGTNQPGVDPRLHNQTE